MKFPINTQDVALMWRDARVGDRVIKRKGDYTFEGTIQAIFTKRNGGAVRYVVEDDRGICMIMNEAQLEPAKNDQVEQR